MITEASFLAGKVIKRTLPVIQGPSGPDAPILKRLWLPQGELAQFYDAPEGIHYVAMIELHPGRPRGNHYHNTKVEWVYILEGKTELRVLDIENQSQEVVVLEVGDLVLIQTRIAHTLCALDPGRAIEFSSSRFELADIQRYALV